MTNQVKHAIIAGGGIGGLCAAIALRQLGVEVTVYEKVSSLGQVGAGLTLWPNAIKALARLGLGQPVIETGARIRHGEIRTSAGRVLAVLQSGRLEQRFGAPAIGIHRADLHRLLLAALPAGAVQLGVACEGFSQDETGVTVHLDGGQSDRAGLLIGADGIHSAIRRQMLPDLKLRYAGYTARRAVVESPVEAALGVTLESWRCGSLFGIVRIDENRVYWFATANTPPGRTQSPAEHKAELRRRFRGWHSPIEPLIEATPAEAILHNDICDFKPIHQWRQGRVALLGDAAHPTTPNMGQGACMAIEDSIVLARALAGPGSLAGRLRRYETERMPRTAWITNQSWQIGRVAQWDHRFACAARDFIFSLISGKLTERQLEKAVGYEV